MCKSEKLRVCVIFNGMVQGVGFRYTVVRIAEQFKVTGYVQNEWDGSVHLVAEGKQSELQHFINEINGSRLQRYIHSFSTNWCAFEGTFHSFEVKR